MKIKLFLITVILGVLFNTKAIGQLYNKTYSVGSGDYFNLSTSKNIQLSDGNFLIASSKMMGNAIVKINQSGDTAWCKNTNIPLYSSQSAELSDGSIYIFSANGYAPICSRISSAGNLLWSNTYSVNSFNMNSTLIGASDGNNGLVMQGTQTDSIFVYAIDQTGNTLYFKALIFNSLFTGSSSKAIQVDNMIYLSSGNYLVAARAITQVGMANKLMLIMLDNSGNVISVKTFDYGLSGFDDYNCNSLYETATGEILMSGIATYSGVRNSSIVKFDSGLNYMWGKKYADDAFKTHCTELSTGEIALSIENSYLVSDGNPKNAVFKTSSTGNFLWGRTFGSTSQNQSAIIGESNGAIQVVGGTSGFGNGALMTYNVDFQGNAIGCFDVITTVPETVFSVTINTAVSTDFFKAVTFSSVLGTISPTSLVAADIGIGLSGTVTNPLCFGDKGGVSIAINGGVAPFNYSWSNGTNSQNLVNASAGNYIFRLSDNQGCVKLDTFDIIQPTQIAATSLATNVTCFGSQDGAINVTTSGGTPGYTFQWATQATTEDISGLSGGFYQVIITDANNCEKIVGIAISEPQQLFAAITSSQNVSCYSACDGSLGGIASGGTAPYVLNWNDNGNTIGPSVSNLCTGNYLFTVTDGNGCVSYSNGTITEPLPLSVTTGSVGSECDAANGEVNAIVSGGTQPFTYLWSNGSTSDTTTLLNPGTYSVTAQDANGCIINASAVVNTVTSPVEICVVTVDSATNKNMIVWTKPVSQNIQGFYIYRNIAGAYSQIGYQPYDSISQYVDNSFGVDPAITSYRYEISVLDSCGNESVLSNFHETIHLTSNLGLNNDVNLIWDDYEGFVFTQYNILRDSTGTGAWEIIANVSNTSFTYTDQFPPQTSTLRYLVEVVLPSTCSATKAQDHNSTRSNRASIANSGTGGTTINELILSQVKAFPNPSNGLLTIEVKSNNWSYYLYDMSGKLIADDSVNEMNREIDVRNLENGIYLLRINLGDSFIHKKIIKE